MENKKTFENVENEEVVAEAPIQEKKKDKKILLVFTLLSLCVYLMVQIPLFSTIDVSGLGELGVEINKFLAESSLNLLFQGSSTLAQPGIILSSNIILFLLNRLFKRELLIQRSCGFFLNFGEKKKNYYFASRFLRKLGWLDISDIS